MRSAAQPALPVLRERGFELHARGDLSGAESIYREVLRQTPADLEVNSALGVLALQTGRYETAAGIFTAAVAARDTADSNCYLGNALAGLSRLEEALHWYDRAIALAPDFAPAYLNRGHALRYLRRHEEALRSYDRVIELQPRFFEALIARAELLCEIDKGSEAIADYDRAIAVRPEAADAYFRRGDLLLKLGRAADSLASADRALSLRRPFPAAWLARAAALEELGRSTEAFAALETAIEEQPDFVKALVGRANLRYLGGDARGAREDFGKAEQCDPTFGPARIGAVIAQIPVVPESIQESLASRDAFRQALARLSSSLRTHPCTAPTLLVGMLQPYHLAYQERDNRELLAPYGQICTELMEEWRQAEGIACTPVRALSTSKVRLAFVSAHVRAHSVYHALTRGFLKHLDRRRFEVHVFHTGAERDAETHGARLLADHYLEGGRSILEWATSIEDCRPDAILYPEIGMDRVSVQLAAQRLAPVQVASWGHPETTGLPTMDFFASADGFEPPGAEVHYTERLVRLPNLGCYYEQIRSCDGARRPGDSMSLAGAGPHLVCPGMPFKYAPEHDWVLVDIARRLGRCRMHLFSSGDGRLTDRLKTRLGAAFSRAGLDADRYLIVHPWVTVGQFHEFLEASDLMLDTIGFSGFNTVLQALECHLPVVTYRGSFLRGRFGMGLLERVGLGELVADTVEDYIERVEFLAGNEPERDRLRDRIRANLPALYGDTASVAGLEAFLIEAVDRAARVPDGGG